MNVLDMNTGIKVAVENEQLVVASDVFASNRKCAVAMADIANRFNTMVLEGRVNYTIELVLDDNNTSWLNERIHDIASYNAEWAVYNVLESMDIDAKGQIVDYVVEGQVVTITVVNPKLSQLRKAFNKQSDLFYDEVLMAKAQLKEQQAKARQERKARKLAQIEAERLLETRMSEAEQTMVAVSEGKVSMEDALAKLNPPTTNNASKDYSIGGLKRIADRNRKAYRKVQGFKYSELVEVEGTVVMRRVSTKVAKARKEAKKQVKVIYKEGDKGYTAPKGTQTPKAPQNTNNSVKFSELGLDTTNKNQGGSIMENMNLQLLASKEVATRDLTNVPNGAEIVKNKWSVISNKQKGKMLGLVMAQNKTTKQIGITETIVSLPENKFTRHLEGIAGALTIGNSVHTFTKEDRFVDKFVTISFDSASSQLYSKEALYMNIKKGIIALPVVDGEEVIYKNIRTGRTVKEALLNKYVLALSTAAGLRGKKGMYNAVFVKLEKGQTVASSMLNPYLHNIIKHANKKMTKEQGAKFMSRPGLAWTEAKNLAKIECSAFYNSKFDSVKIRNTFDGVAFARASFIGRVFGVTPLQACQLALQSRPGGIIKVQVKVLNDELFDVYADFLNETGLLDVTGGTIDDVDFIYDTNSRKAEIDVDDLELEVLAVGKMTEVAFSKQIIEKLFLEAAIMDKENGNDDITKEVEEFILQLGKDEITRVIVDLLKTEQSVSSDVEYIYDIINKVSKNNIPAAKKSAMANALRTIAKLIDKLSFTDGNMFYNTIYTDTAQLFGYEIINEGEIFYPSMINTDSKKGLMFKYPSMGGKEFYSFKTISFDTICKRINSIEKINSKVRRALIEEYKTISKDLVVLPASREVFDSCAGLDIDMDAAALVFTELVVKVLYGKEEQVHLSTEKATNGKVIAKEVKNEVDDLLKNALLKEAKNNNKSAVQSLNRSIFNPEKDNFYGRLFNVATTGEIKSVGEITISNNKTIAIATEAIKGNLNPINALVKENIGKTTGINEEYKGLPTKDDAIQLSETNIDAMLKEAKNLKLDQQNLIRLALDINRCFRLYQETTIDAAKTGIAVAIAIMVNSVEVKSLYKVQFVEKTVDKGLVSYVIEREEKELKTKTVIINNKKVFIDPILIEDSMSKIQDKLIEFAMAMKNSAENNHELYSFHGVSSNKEDGSMEAMINNALDSFRSRFPQHTQYLQEIRTIYSILVGEYVSALNKIDEESEEERAILKSQFTLKLEHLSNTVEKLLMNVKGRTAQSTAMNKGFILIAIGALTSKGVVSPNSANKFAFSVAPHYALTYALASDRYVNDCKVLHCADHVEGEVEVINGFSADNSLIVKENFKNREGGKATLNVTRDEDGNVRVTETKIIEIPEIDNNKATMVLSAQLQNLLDVDGNVVLDASGSTIVKAIDDSGKILENMPNEVFAKKDKEGNVKFAYKADGKVYVLDMPTDKIRLTDIQANVKYKVTFGYIAASTADNDKVQDGRVVLELTK